MRKLIITRGLPGSGKSTFARALLANEPGKWKRVNRDDLRGMLDDHAFSKANERFVVAQQERIVREAFAAGFDVVMDNTHLVADTLKHIHRMAEDVGDVHVVEMAFNVPVEECVRRNAERTGHAQVPEKVIRDMARACGADRGKAIAAREVTYPPRPMGGTMTQDETLPPAVLCDLDGTLALFMGMRSPYDASTCDQDKPNPAVLACICAMQTAGVEVIFMSGRKSEYREQTERFLAKCWPWTSKSSLYMRATGDDRKDVIVKRELYEQHVLGKHRVLFVLDDRNQVVDGWRAMGLTCFQVAPGAF